ncbi:MAG: hypothetical protein M1825_004352 [Sarcosagium campestre]|nr:MAG: hypothetical protein M1825_004352 [Sarcosagium campestre]
MDSLQSLLYVADNVDDWLSQLDGLTAQIANRQHELKELHVHQLKRKNGSTESLRPKADAPNLNVNANTDTAAPVLLEPTEPSPLSAGSRQHYIQQMQRRKRKTDSILSNMEPTKYRTRSMIIVYYDSAVQEAFEGIVRNLGIARNNIRKGRMAAKIHVMTSMSDDMPDLDDPSFRMKLSYTRASRPRGGEEKTVYDAIDQALESAQSLCEHGAHQFLRDGDCASEISGIKSKMSEAASLCSGEIPKLREEAEKRKAEEGGSEEEEEEDEEEEEQTGEKDGEKNTKFKGSTFASTDKREETFKAGKDSEAATLPDLSGSSIDSQRGMKVIEVDAQS